MIFSNRCLSPKIRAYRKANTLALATETLGGFRPHNYISRFEWEFPSLQCFRRKTYRLSKHRPFPLSKIKNTVPINIMLIAAALLRVSNIHATPLRLGKTGA